MSKTVAVMFPYPSGSGLHIGHWYNYAVVDSYCKVLKYRGQEVYQPFGYDAFGLPAENYARKVGRDPEEVTWENIESFRKEMTRMDVSWEERLITCTPEYIKKTQQLFLNLLNHGLAYKAKREENYCPSCETVLAREQVKQDKCERCNSSVEKKELEQWFFKITAYKDRLIADLDKVDYPEKTKKQQIQWMGENFHDWCVSRQRKWGCPIPLPGETDTLDTFVDSSFYTHEYDPEHPVDIYVGGNEHACMHLIYARFITKFRYDIGEIPYDEPFLKVVHQGMILKDGEKMSKSKGNVVDPSAYDPQELKMYLMFINHYFEGGSWNDNNFRGVQKFKAKIQRWTSNTSDQGEDINLQEFEQKIFNFFDAWKTNKVVSEWMIFYKTHCNKVLTERTAQSIKTFFNACF